MPTLLKELNKYARGKNHKKYVYFLYKNKLKNTRTDYGKMTEKEFVDKYLDGNPQRLLFLELWEKQEDYKKLVDLMIVENSRQDFVKIYNAVRDKAVEGDDKAIKTFLMLQKEAEKSLKKAKKTKEIEEQEEDFEGLDLEE